MCQFTSLLTEHFDFFKLRRNRVKMDSIKEARRDLLIVKSRAPPVNTKKKYEAGRGRQKMPFEI